MIEELTGGVVSAGRSSFAARSMLSTFGIAIAALTLAGCNMSSGNGQQATLGSTGYVGSAPDFRTQMVNVGSEYGSAVSFGDTTHVTNLVSSCYSQWDQISAPNESTMGIAYTQYSLHRCLELDYLGYKDNQALTNQGLVGNPYFSADAFRLRWDRYGIAAGFTHAENLYQWAREGYAIAKPYANDAIRHHQGFQLDAPQPVTGVFGGGS